MTLVLDRRIGHNRVGSGSDPTLNGHLPNNLERSLNKTVVDKIRKYHTDYNNNPPSVVSFMVVIVSTSGRLHGEFIRLVFLQDHRETDPFFAVSGFQIAHSDLGFFHYLRADFSSILRSHVGNILGKTESLHVTLNLDGTPITSKSHTHLTYS